MGRVRYAVLERNRLQSIQANFVEFRDSFILMMNFVNTKANDQHFRNSSAGMDLLNEIHKKQIRDAKTRRMEAQDREKIDAKLEEILTILQKPIPSSVPNAEFDQPAQILDRLKNELIKSGLPEDKAQAAQRSAAQALTVEESKLPKIPLGTKSSGPLPMPDGSSARKPSQQTAKLQEAVPLKSCGSRRNIAFFA